VRLVLSATLVAALLVSSLLFLALSYLRSRSSLPEASVAVDKIEGGELLAGGYLSEVGHSGIRLSFNEGSRFALEPGTRGRLRALSPEGARLSLERGTVACQITENHERRWSVEAGPFVVTVRGTDFEVDWDPAHEELAVSLRRGRVAVSGPGVGDELVLTPGQTLSVSLPRRETVISEGRSKATSRSEAPPPSSATASLKTPIAPPTASCEPTASSGTPARGSASASPESTRAWRDAIATGQWDRILADADRAGADTMLRSLTSEELFALADAARYRRRADLARAALLEQRRRFPSSGRSLDALFLLGRVEEQQGGKRTAIQRYDEYLERAPGGTYAAEALGRRMILTQAVEGAASARRIAGDYLRRFPLGSYAQAARTLEQLP
jgi:TolA-binding protein